MRGAVADVVNAALPSDCLICGGPVVQLGRVPVCECCAARVNARQPDEPGTLCARCGDGLGMESARFTAGMMGASECTMCRLAPPEFARAVAFASYDHEVREALHLLKFNGLQAVAEHVLGDGMAAAILKLEEQAARELVVVPVPLFAARRRSRGFNQAEVLAMAGVAKLRRLRPEWKLSLRSQVLERVKDTRAQFSLEPHIRRRNLRGAFRVEDAGAIQDREVLLVDDILTTGATARECSRVLLRAGAEKVWVATMARTRTEESASGHSHVAVWDAVKQPGPATGFL